MCCAFQPFEVLQFVSSSEPYVCSAFSPSLPSLIRDVVSIGSVSIYTDLVSVTVSGGWLPLAELPWIPACPAQGSWLIARPGIATHYSRHHPQAHLLVMSLTVVNVNDQDKAKIID